MATTRTSEKKSTAKKTAATTAAADPNEALASEILNTLLHRALVRLGEPARVGDVAREVGDEAGDARPRPASDGEPPAPLCRRGSPLGHHDPLPGQEPSLWSRYWGK